VDARFDCADGAPLEYRDLLETQLVELREYERRTHRFFERLNRDSNASLAFEFTSLFGRAG
jgi:hypothetical protein